MSAISEDRELLHDFLVEAGELLDDVDAKLVELEHSPADAELLNCIFRGFHTIKGGAGFLEATALVQVCHRTETLFDRLRGAKIALDALLMDDILAATAEVRRMFAEMASGVELTPAPDALLASLGAAAEGAAKPHAPPAAANPPPSPAAAAPAPSSVAPTPRPASDSPPAAAAMPPATPAKKFTGEPDWQALYDALLGRGTTVPAAPPESAPPPSAPTVSPPLPAAKAAPEAARAGPAHRAEADTTIRVDTHRFDDILALSGEIALMRNRLSFLRTALVRGKADEQTLPGLDVAVNRLGTLVSELQTVVMKSRMQPVGRVFQKYSRVARDLARQLGKEVDFVLEGEETEVDKTILEKLNDPIVHLVRNSVDHGIEMPAERLAAGKPARGRVTLSARQAGDRIVVEIVDDGRGMSPERLRLKAIEKGVIAAADAATLDEREILNLIFLPGFSTKDQVTDLSGRGVGMDVVKTNITKLKGKVDIASRPGQGSRVTILLPLTLAIMPVLLFRVGKQPFAVSLAAVQEVIVIEEAALRSVSGRPGLAVRGETLPVLGLDMLVGVPGEVPGTAGIVAHVGERRVVLRADQVIGQDEVMIKALSGMKAAGVAGATLSGDGVVVLVLELDELIEASGIAR